MNALETLLESLQMPATTETAVSAIESRFPHIVRELCALWDTDQVELYLDSLLIDKRGGRIGFPKDVLEELMLLSGMRWYLRPKAGGVADYQTTDIFSFSARNEHDLRWARSKTAWVLE